MKKIAPELDSLMWTLAEEGNDRAIDEFGARNPQMRAELLRRITMVKALRSAGKEPKQAPVSIPRFVPKEPRGMLFQSKASKFVGGLVLAALAAFAFAVTVLVTPPPHVRSPDPKPHSETPSKSEQTSPPIVLPPVDNSTEVNNSKPPKEESNETASLKKAKLHIDHAPLLTVLKMIGASCGVNIVPGPGMTNPTVEADYQDMSAMEMLQDLGRKFSFTAFDQHDGSVLVVPGVDKGDSTRGAGNGRGSSGDNRSPKIGG